VNLNSKRLARGQVTFFSCNLDQPAGGSAQSNPFLHTTAAQFAKS
jgi:hypothetical protein